MPPSTTSPTGGMPASRRSSRRSSSGACLLSRESAAGRTTWTSSSATAAGRGRRRVTREPASSHSEERRVCWTRLRSFSSTRRSLEPAAERCKPERRHPRNGLEEDRATHFRMSRGAIGEADRHLDDAKSSAQRAVRGFDLERIPLRVDRVEIERLKHVSPVALEAAREVADADAEQHARVERAAPGDEAANDSPVLGAAALDVARAEREGGTRLARCDQSPDVRGVVGEGAVHLQNELCIAREGLLEPGDIGRTQALLAFAVKDGDEVELLCETVRDLAGAVGGVVVDD